MLRFLLVCLGGAIGTGARYLTGLWAQNHLGTFPYATLIVNLTGCFLIAMIMTAATEVKGFPPDLRFFLVTGVMGGLTTYSSFNYETIALFESTPVRGAINLGATLVGCATAGLLGLILGRALFD
jgi:CrcB protein